MGSIWPSGDFKVVDISQDIENPRKSVPKNQTLEIALDETVNGFVSLGDKSTPSIAARQ